MIEISELYTGYSRDKPLLKNFNYQFDSKIYGILGESGCGKTTLLRTIAGLVKPLSGTISVNGELITNASKNNIYMMHQNYTSFDWLKCLDNILIAKKVKGRINKCDVDRAKEMMKLVGLENSEDKYPKQLSGGMRQRLALARTLFMNPGIILMDEPLSALDIETRERMQDLIINQHKETSSTIIMVTHSREEANKMCDVIIEFKNYMEVKNEFKGFFR
jgi:ABC-type nitrate/sulfonate/bicarbonate transport system ATPase subunit